MYSGAPWNRDGKIQPSSPRRFPPLVYHSRFSFVSNETNFDVRTKRIFLFLSSFPSFVFFFFFFFSNNSRNERPGFSFQLIWRHGVFFHFETKDHGFLFAILETKIFHFNWFISSDDWLISVDVLHVRNTFLIKSLHFNEQSALKFREIVKFHFDWWNPIRRKYKKKKKKKIRRVFRRNARYSRFLIQSKATEMKFPSLKEGAKNSTFQF